jgi:oligopeptide/dipeptide ABC transporter ATP-binding protein
MEPIVRTENLAKHFPLTRSLGEFFTGQSALSVRAVDGVSIDIPAGKTLGLIGESGSGKTTLGWMIARVYPATSGRVYFDGQDVSELAGTALRRWRRNVQVVFQDPIGSLDPRMRVWEIVGEPIRAQNPGMGRSALRGQVAELLPSVGLASDCLDQYPHEFSGGGRQRLSLARALGVSPRLVVLDEPTSALDVAVQAQILNRLVLLQREFGFAYLLITHNVSAVRFVADRVAVMYLGKLAEAGDVEDVLDRPLHPYTKALLAALPVTDTRRRRVRYKLTGEIPTLVRPPPGCRFSSRCPFVVDRCRVEEPALREIAGRPGQLVACHRAEEIVDVAPAALLEPLLPERSATPTVPG